MESFSVQTVVIGAGVVGLACAAALSKSGREVLVLERNFGIGEEVSARNSEVIHAGIYYAPNSLKARLCVAGRKQLYGYCKERGVASRALGKLIVANSEDDLATLEKLRQTGLANGVDDLVMLNQKQAITMEPALRCLGALYSPSTGIIDSHGLMLSLQGELEENDGMISFGSVVRNIFAKDDELVLQVESDGEANAQYDIIARDVVNCAGLDAVGVAHRTTGMADIELPQAHYSKGNYFKLQGACPFGMLIYPAPVPGGLGTHLVLDIEGAARFGPDVEVAEHAGVSLEVDPSRADSFYQSVRRYWPEVDQHKLVADYAGLRPKTSAQGSNLNDFQILDQNRHGVKGLVHCLGIESPGLTSSLAIAATVSDRLGIQPS